MFRIPEVRVVSVQCWLERANANAHRTDDVGSLYLLYVLLILELTLQLSLARLSYLRPRAVSAM